MRVALSTLLLLCISACADDSARILFNDAVAALRSGDLVKAEILAEKAAARGGQALAPHRDFVLGCAAFARCDREEIKIYGPRGGSAAIEAALKHAEDARNLFESAAAGKGDWPAARRNAERALLKIAILRKMKEEADALAQSRPQPQPKPTGSNDIGAPADRGEDRRPTPRVDPLVTELKPEQITRVLERLNEKEKEKLKIRRAEHRAQRSQVEKDW